MTILFFELIYWFQRYDLVGSQSKHKIRSEFFNLGGPIALTLTLAKRTERSNNCGLTRISSTITKSYEGQIKLLQLQLQLQCL